MTDPSESLAPEAVAERIRRHRTAEIALTFKDADGRPLAGQEVAVRQSDHRFRFGSNCYKLGRIDDPAAERAYRRRFTGLLNFATIPFYWGAYERRPGETERENRLWTARWCRDRGLATKGHPLCWHAVPPKWLADASVKEIEARQIERIESEVSAFAGLIDTWDVVNEAVIMTAGKWARTPVGRLCRARGRKNLLARCFAAARSAHPGATLILNDFITDARYERVIAECLDAGVEIDVLGIQSHMHGGYWGAERAWEVCERFSRFGLPIHFTELTILSGRPRGEVDWGGKGSRWTADAAGEQTQAEQVAELYTTLFSHPSVDAVTWWDFSDYGSWMGAPSGFVREDMSPKPAYDRLKKLIGGAWRTRERVRTDDRGRAKVTGYCGAYEASSGGLSGGFEVAAPGRCRRTVRLA